MIGINNLEKLFVAFKKGDWFTCFLNHKCSRTARFYGVDVCFYVYLGIVKGLWSPLSSGFDGGFTGD